MYTIDQKSQMLDQLLDSQWTMKCKQYNLPQFCAKLKHMTVSYMDAQVLLIVKELTDLSTKYTVCEKKPQISSCYSRIIKPVT